MPLASGTRLGNFEIVALIGAGGMGEVYRARDSKLKRDVALKVLPEAFALEAGRVARFEREAEVLASLNHANIAVLHDVGRGADRPFLVMELVEGETLADRLRAGPLPIDATLQVGAQIAQALEAAHERGVVHRDLKPANIKVARDGSVKVLDFGLAKVFEDGTSSVVGSSPTITVNTAAGMIVGTPAYMSPEQARGGPVDSRTDIWALGCVIFEMLTGRPAFGGSSLSDTIAAVLRGEPDWRLLPAETPPRVRVLLGRCLRKDPRQRLHDAADARIEIEDAGADTIQSANRDGQPPARQLLAVALALLAGASVASAVWWVRGRTAGQSPTPLHLSLTTLPRAAASMTMNANHEVAISRDGRHIVYVASEDGRRRLMLRSLAEARERPIEGTDGAVTAFFSPDGEWIAFANEQSLQKVAVSGGSPVTICTLSSTGFYAGDWGTDDAIVFVPDYNGGLWSVPSSGGTPTSLLKTDPDHDVVAYVDPSVLPGGQGVLFTSASGHAVKADDQDIGVLKTGTQVPRILIRGGSNARYLPSGHLVYVHGGALLSVPFDLSMLTVTGTPVPVLEDLGRTWSGDANYAVSASGTLVFEPGTGVQTGRQFVVVDRQGHVRPIAPPANNGEFRMSPDGRHLAARMFAINDDIWVYDVATGTPVRLTFEPLDEISPCWTPDGRRIAYGTRTGTIFWRPADGSGAREAISHGDSTRYPDSFSPGSRTLAFVEIHPTRHRDIWLLALDGDRQARPLLATDADEWGARFSPDGRWLAYVSDETGRDEVFVRPADGTGGRQRLSSEGGIGPEWAPSGREVFFLKGDQLRAVAMNADGDPAGVDRAVFTVQKFEGREFVPGQPEFAVMPDGEHFVFGLSPQPPAATPFDLVINWFVELNQKRLTR